MIFCSQYPTDDWYERLDPAFAEGSPIYESIMDRIIHNAYDVFICRLPNSIFVVINH